MDISEYLFKKDIDKSKQMKIYNFFHELETCNIYDNIIKIETMNNDNKFSELIKDNYDKMDIDEMKTVLSKCITDNGVKHILLKYELMNYKCEPKKLHLKEFSEIAQRQLSRYQFKAGGFGFRCEWILHSKPDKIKIKENEIVFENIITSENLTSPETMEYMKCIVSMLTRLSLLIKISIHSKYCDRDKLHRVFIKCTELKMN